MNVSSNRFALGVVVLLHLVLGLAYAFQTPYHTPGIYALMGGVRIPDIGAPDELEHVQYIQYLANGNGFPVLNPQNPNAGAGYQSHQPPLFYILESGVAKLTGLSRLNVRSAGLVLRAFNVLIGCTDVVGVFFLGYWGFGNKDAGLAGAAFLALLPMNLALSGAVSNDPMLFSLCTWTLAVTALGARCGWSMKRGIAVGILLGLAMLTKTTAAALVPAVLIGVYFSAKRPKASVLIGAAAVALVLALPWWLRNQTLYGDPFAMKAFNEAFIHSPTLQSLHWDLAHYIRIEVLLTWNSFIGDFGYMDIALPPEVVWPAGIVLGIMGLGGLLALRKSARADGTAATNMYLAFIVFVVFAYVGFNLRYFQAQARYIFPAIGPISLLFGLGLKFYAKEKWKVSFVAWTASLTALNLWIVTQYLPPAFELRLT